MGISSDLALALDGVAFARAAGYVLDDWQAAVLREMPRRLLLNCSRQAGKTLVAALWAVHAALYEPGAFVVAVAVAQRQSMELIRTCRDIYGRLGRPVPAEAENKLSLELENGSRILSIPASEATVRGLSAVRLLIVDEAARVPDALYYAVLAFLAVSAGKLALLSTPWGTRGFYYQAYCERERWAYYEVPAERIPRIPASFLEEQRRTLGSYWYDQDYRCIFREAEESVFRQQDIERAIKDYEVWDFARFLPPAMQPVPADAAPREPAPSMKWDLPPIQPATWGSERRALTPAEEAAARARQFEADVRRMFGR